VAIKVEENELLDTGKAMNGRVPAGQHLKFIAISVEFPRNYPKREFATNDTINLKLKTQMPMTISMSCLHVLSRLSAQMQTSEDA
jgi:hypothetical protein